MLITYSWVIPCEMDQISERFPPDPHGFYWNFAKSIYPSRNVNPKNFKNGSKITAT